MSYCTGCGQPRSGPAPVCTVCGTPFGGPPPPEEDAFGSWFRPDQVPAGPDQTQRIPAPSDPGPGGTGSGRPPVQRQAVTSRRIVAALAVLVLLAAAGTGAWLTLRHPRAAAVPPGAAGRTHTTSRPPRSTAPAATARPPATGLVAVAPGVSRQAAEPRVVAFLNDYFTAINQHDYQRYSVLLGPLVRRVETAPVFSSGYRTTTDSAVTLTGISAPGGGRLAAAVTFTSHQAPADTPTRSGCTDWRIILVLAPQHGGLVLEPPPPGYHASYQAC
jgi:hypothetical protein